ncbi:hypothetical protein R1flu_012807 [Riccia fluitans]|uniref:SMP-30/Gluconolactonase/LRE-like region domain-containing protein n=1 Tax=Riccia fluitans TaxID=41844 RepID=A0ABD1ZBU9_9MARC
MIRPIHLPPARPLKLTSGLIHTPRGILSPCHKDKRLKGDAVVRTCIPTFERSVFSPVVVQEAHGNKSRALNSKKRFAISSGVDMSNLGGDQDHRVYRFYEARTSVGKGGIWDPHQRKYYYVDIQGKSLHILTLSGSEVQREDYDVGISVGAMALIEGGWGLVMAVRDGFGIWDFSKKKLELVATPYGVNSGWRMNDGACDSKGRFWAGRLFDTDETKPGQIYRLENDGKTATPVIDGICCTNGVLWSPDNTLMYVGDSTNKKIFVWDYDEESGTPSNKRLLIDTSKIFHGVPDGATIDQEGYLWTCFFDGHKMARISPDGTVDRVYDLPVKRPTQPCWYGDKLDTLLITSASKDVNITNCPESGNILKVHVGVQGQLKAKYKLKSRSDRVASPGSS